jgi:hypothetical protein
MLRLLEFGFDEEAKGTQWAREALVTTSSGRLRFGLDLVSTLAIVAACTVIVWTRYGPPTAALRTLPAPENPVSLEGTVIRGAPDAPVTSAICPSRRSIQPRLVWRRLSSSARGLPRTTRERWIASSAGGRRWPGPAPPLA